MNALPSSFTLNQIELWKTTEWRVPQRKRPGAIFYKQIPKSTRFNGIAADTKLISGEGILYNLGFCVSSKIMYWKHLTGLTFHKTIGDSESDEKWFEDKWLNWKEKDTNLAIAKRHSHAIPYASPYDMPREDKKVLKDKVLKIREKDKEYR